MINEYRVELPVMVFGKWKAAFLAIKAKNVPGVIDKVSRVLAEASFNVLHGVHSVSQEGDVGCWVLLVDGSNARKSLSEVVAELKRDERILDVDYGLSAINGLLLAPFSIRYEISGESVMLFRRVFIDELLRAFVSVFGNASLVFLYHAGVRSGKSMANWWKTRVPRLSIIDYLKLCLEMWKKLGWVSDYEIVSANPSGFFRVRVWDCFTCTPFRGAKEPVGYFARGMLEGYLEGMLGFDLESREVRCIATGDKYCEFVLTKAGR